MIPSLQRAPPPRVLPPAAALKHQVRAHLQKQSHINNRLQYSREQGDVAQHRSFVGMRRDVGMSSACRYGSSTSARHGFICAGEQLETGLVHRLWPCLKSQISGPSRPTMHVTLMLTCLPPFSVPHIGSSARTRQCTSAERLMVMAARLPVKALLACLTGDRMEAVPLLLPRPAAHTEGGLTHPHGLHCRALHQPEKGCTDGKCMCTPYAGAWVLAMNTSALVRSDLRQNGSMKYHHSTCQKSFTLGCWLPTSKGRLITPCKKGPADPL